MAITDKEQGVWELDEVYNKINQGGIWSYDGISELFTVGYNNFGSLGQNDRTYRSSPVQVTGSWVAASSATTISALALRSDGTLWGMGYNEYGELGLNNNTRYSSPTQIPGSWVSLAGGGGAMGAVSAIKTDGTLWAWGQNEYGQLGINKNPSNFDFVSSPTQVGTDTTWSTDTTLTQVTIAQMSAAIKSDGTLWTWGYNGGGGLAQNNQTNRSSPVQVPGTTWSSVGHGDSNLMAFKTDGTMWTCGGNGYGELGIGNRTQYSSPKQVPGTTWKNGLNADNSAGAVKTDGTLWTWGRNQSGQLGQNDSHSPGPSSKLDPTQVPGTTWDSISAAPASWYGNKTEGTLWAWGTNSNGNLGLNDKTSRSSPTQIPGTIWASFVRNGAQGNSANFLTSA